MDKEDEIIKGCLLGSYSHQHALYKKYAGKMMGICLRYIKDRSEAEDVFQEAFTKVFNNLKAYRGPKLEAWMKRIFINNCINSYHRNKKSLQQVEYDDAPEANLMFDDALSSISNEELLTIINSLPTGYKLVFNLYAIEGYTHKEIAELLKINEGTSKSQFSKARKLLQKILISLYPNVYENR